MAWFAWQVPRFGGRLSEIKCMQSLSASRGTYRQALEIVAAFVDYGPVYGDTIFSIISAFGDFVVAKRWRLRIVCPAVFSWQVSKDECMNTPFLLHCIFAMVDLDE